MADIALHSMAPNNHSQTDSITRVTSSSRTLTLGSNRPVGTQPDVTRRQLLSLQPHQLLSWLNAQFRDVDIPDDDTEKLIKDKIEDMTKKTKPGTWSQRFSLQRLLSDYVWIKDMPCQKVVPDLIETWIFSDTTDIDGIKSKVVLRLLN